MPRGLPKTVRENLEKCSWAAIAAVEAYNRPGPRFRTAQYLVMIVIAWTALFHAIFYKQGTNPWYRSNSSSKGRAIRYVKIDGEPKHWDLAECLNRHFGDTNPPERGNLQFLLGLRNKIEHRHLPEMDAALFGECQAALLNLEELLVERFGSKYALQDQLAVSLQFTKSAPPEKKRAAGALARANASGVVDYIERFRGRLPSTVLNSMKYSYNVFLVPRVAGRESASDIAVEFVHVDEASSEELDRLSKLNVLIREKHIPILNVDLTRPTEVVHVVAAEIPFKFSIADHTSAWKHFGVRPPTGSAHPEKTVPEYAVYDSAHGDYLYTKAWSQRLIRELTSSDQYEKIIGRAAKREA